MREIDVKKMKKLDNINWVRTQGGRMGEGGRGWIQQQWSSDWRTLQPDK